MSDKEFHGQILGRLGGIEAEIKGVHEQLKIQNGRISRNDDRISRLSSWQDKADGGRAAKWTIWIMAINTAGVVGVIVRLLTM